MQWDKEKVLILEDEYPYCDIKELANKLGTTVKSVQRKAEKLKLKRATKNDIIMGYKYCCFCDAEHPISEFYRNKTKKNGFEYYCKKYYNKDAINEEINNQLKTSTIVIKESIITNKYSTRKKRNPIVIYNGTEGKKCNMCKTWKPLSQYWTDKNGIGEKKAICIECYKEKYNAKSTTINVKQS